MVAGIWRGRKPAEEAAEVGAALRPSSRSIVDSLVESGGFVDVDPPAGRPAPAAPTAAEQTARNCASRAKSLWLSASELRAEEGLSDEEAAAIDSVMTKALESLDAMREISERRREGREKKLAERVERIVESGRRVKFGDRP